MSEKLEAWKKYKVKKSRDTLGSYINSCNTKGGRLRDDVDKIYKHIKVKNQMRNK